MKEIRIKLSAHFHQSVINSNPIWHTRTSSTFLRTYAPNTHEGISLGLGSNEKGSPSDLAV